MSHEKKTWDRRDVFALIADWKLTPALWDAKHKSYRSKIVKQTVLEELAAKYSTNANEINRKLHNLRTQYHSEIRRIRTKNGEDGTDYPYHTSWEFFDALKFIAGDTLDPASTGEMVSIFGGRMFSLFNHAPFCSK